MRPLGLATGSSVAVSVNEQYPNGNCVYRNVCKKYRKDTGNGGGKPEIFMDWNKNEDVNFQYFCRGQSAALLTWVFMKDRESHYILEEEKDVIPLNIQVEDSTNFSVERSSTTRRRSPTSVGKGLEECHPCLKVFLIILLKERFKYELSRHG